VPTELELDDPCDLFLPLPTDLTLAKMPPTLGSELTESAVRSPPDVILLLTTDLALVSIRCVFALFFELMELAEPRERSSEGVSVSLSLPTDLALVSAC
jgi:hypothetical protein